MHWCVNTLRIFCPSEEPKTTLNTYQQPWPQDLFSVQVRGLPCAHNFHVECIDEWLRLNVKCPRCRCSVFPNLDLSALSNLRPDSERSSTSVMMATRYVRSQPSSQSYLLRLQGLLRPIRAENTGPVNDSSDIDLETSHNGTQHCTLRPFNFFFLWYLFQYRF